MRRTPQYKLPFNQTGDLYSASSDQERMTVVDNELYAISQTVGDGVLSGWTVTSIGGLDVRVSRGSGFISSVLHATLSDKELPVSDDATSIIYMRSNMFGSSGGFPISVEGPPSDRASASFSDTTPPSAPTNLAATAVDFDVVSLVWDANSEADINHYVIQRAEDSLFTVNLVTVASPETNGTISNPLVDSGLSESTTYYYRSSAVDNSGNASAWEPFGSSSTTSVTTPQDLTKPTDPQVLRLYPGNSTMSVMFESSRTDDVVSHDVTYYRINSDGSVILPGTTISVAMPGETTFVNGLLNGNRYRFVVRAVRNNGVKSDGIIKDETPYAVPSPLDAPALSATATAAGMQLSWTASTSATGSSIGQKSEYRIYVIDPSWNESAPLTDVGLATSRLVSSYFESATVGFGERAYLEDGKRYGFRVTTLDPFGNESGGRLIRATTLDLAPPRGPRSLEAEAGDGEVALSWRHSTSDDVVGYKLSYGATTIDLEYVTSHVVDSLTNGVPVTFSLQARDATGNVSTAISATATPEEDTTPPPVPVETTVKVGDQSLTFSWAPSAAEDFDHYVVWRREVREPVMTPPNLPLTTIAGTETFATVYSPEFFDVDLDNGHTYAYAVKAVDLRGNESDYSGVTLSSPSEGINSGSTRLYMPTSVVVTAGAGIVFLSWQFYYPGQYEDSPDHWVYPDGGPTDFNVYRSTEQYAGYQFLASIPSSTRSYPDSTVAGSQSGPVTYWYVVTAVRDNASPIADTGAIQPAHSIPLATIVARSGVIVSVENEQRIVGELYATLYEETTKRLLLHKHSVKPTNSTTVTAIGELAAIDASTLGSVTLSSYDLSDSALSYYQDLKSRASSFTTGTAFAIHPASIVGNVPRVGDFQFLVSGARPSTSYVLDAEDNLIILSSPVDGTKTFNGQRVNFYVPAALDLDYRGYDVQVDGVTSSTARVDEPTQVVRTASIIPSSSVVTVIIEPTIPEFGDQQGARQVSLSPNIVLNDFVTQNQSTYTSEFGAFDDSDTVFVLVNGTRTALDHYVDFVTKSIVFGEALPAGTNVALEIVNREEVQGLLPASSVEGLDGSQVKTSKLLKAQLPPISHAGRIKERAWPTFNEAATTNWYSFSAEVGNGTTPYSFSPISGGGILVGTSSGILRSYLSSGILVSATDKLNASSDILSALPISPSALADAAEYAAKYKSGRLQGTIEGVMLPSVVVLQDGKVLITGGGVYDQLGRLTLGVTTCAIYDPVAGTFSAASPMSTARIYHTCTLLPDGRVVVTGGRTYPADAYVLDTSLYPNGLAPIWHHSSCELYNPSTDSWQSISSLSTARYNHSANLLPDSPYDLVVTGGTTVYNPASPIEWDEIPATPTTTGYTDERYWVKREIASSERMALSSFSWSDTGDLNDPSEVKSSVVEGALSVTGSRNREVYDDVEGTWSATSVSDASQNPSDSRIDVTEPIKQFMTGSDGYIYAVSRNSVYVSSDQGFNYIKMSGLDAVGVVHRIIETSTGTLMAATDLGVYAITPDIRTAMTWFAGGLIGAGTTETFDLLEYGGATYGMARVLASTEIGIYETSDDAETWTLVDDDLEDVRNMELMGDVLYATVGQAIYRSVDSVTWSKLSFQEVITESSVLRTHGSELLLGTTTGLYWSEDGIEFELVGFDRNRDPERNAVFMLEISGGDAIVGYEDSIFSLDESRGAIRIAEFGGSIPTVRVDGEVSRGGYRYDTSNKQVVFEFKRLAESVVEVACEYSLFTMEGGGWYHQNPDAPVQVYVSAAVVDTGYAYDAWNGQFVFEDSLTKFDPVTISVYGTTLLNEGELLHEEVEDGLEAEKGLPLSLGRDYAAGVLQMGVSVEHNFLERGIERNQYYCMETSLVDRSFNAFLKNAEFYVMGRRDFDRFNSTIDYAEESSQDDIGEAALVPYCVLEYLPSQVLIGTDAGIFVVDPTNVSAPFSVTGVVRVGDIEDNAVYDLKNLDVGVMAVTRDGLYELTPSGSTFTSEKNAGNGLPDEIHVVSSINNLLVIGASDGIYYADSFSDPPYETWYKASLVDSSNQAQEGGSCVAIVSSSGIMFAGVENAYYSSTDGKTWEKRYAFAPVDGQATTVLELGPFAEQVFALTNKGLYTDNGSSKSNTVVFSQSDLTSIIEAQFPDALTPSGKYKTYLGDVHVADDSMHVVGSVPYAYKLQSGEWTWEPLGADSAHKIFVTSLEKRMAVVGNLILTE